MYEFIIPASEGPVSQNPKVFREFYQYDFPFEIGSLEREAFTYLGKWMIIMSDDGYGMAHRLGIKDGVIDQEGYPTTLFLHFGLPIKRKENELNDEAIGRQYENFKKIIKASTVMFAEDLGNVAAFNPDPPEYMIRELEDALREYYFYICKPAMKNGRFLENLFTYI